MHDSFAALLTQPTARRYKQVRSQLLAASALGDFSLRLASLDRALQENDLEFAQESVEALFPSGLLSLRLHRLGGELALRTNNRLAEPTRAEASRAELHRFTYDALTTAITATGDGTRRRPLLITYTSDAVEILATRGFRVVSQSLVEDRARRLDVLLTDQEREFWFDVTDLLPKTALLVPRKKRNMVGSR